MWPLITRGSATADRGLQEIAVEAAMRRPWHGVVEEASQRYSLRHQNHLEAMIRMLWDTKDMLARESRNVRITAGVLQTEDELLYINPYLVMQVYPIECFCCHGIAIAAAGGAIVDRSSSV
jgi:hypothetical protein